jgi:hypothetical protein
LAVSDKSIPIRSSVLAGIKHRKQDYKRAGYDSQKQMIRKNRIHSCLKQMSKGTAHQRNYQLSDKYHHGT